MANWTGQGLGDEVSIKIEKAGPMWAHWVDLSNTFVLDKRSGHKKVNESTRTHKYPLPAMLLAESWDTGDNHKCQEPEELILGRHTHKNTSGHPYKETDEIEDEPNGGNAI